MVTSRRRSGRSDSRQGGMTLVEIMVTLIISSIIAASTFMFFAGQQRIYETQTRLLNIQQNLWASMEVVARYTRASGSGMYECVHPAAGVQLSAVQASVSPQVVTPLPSAAWQAALEGASWSRTVR